MLVIALVFAWYIVYGGASAAADQARAEARLAGQAIRDDLKARRQAWADDLSSRLENGRKKGPTTAMWWGWAGLRTAKALRRALRRQPREAERAAIRGTAGPFRRIWDAGRRGATFARDEARRQREAYEERRRVPVGVCGRCGAVAARVALKWALTRRGTQERMCAKCRDEVAGQRKADEEASQERAQQSDDVADADVAGDRPQIRAPRPELEGPSPEPASPQPGAPAGPQPRPELPTPPSPEEQPGPADAPAVGSDSTPAIEGAPVPPRTPGQVVPRRTVAPAHSMRGTGGESYTHGQFNRAVTDIRRRLDQLPDALEQMLSSLTSADAGRSQVQGVMATHRAALDFMAQVEHMLTEVNRRANPVVAAVTAAGGPEEIASISYLREV